MIKKVGFFHFGGEDRSHPADSLKGSLSEASRAHDLSECLIVTPEAFNILSGYHNPGRSRESFRIAKEKLRNLSIDFKVALVVGLIEEPDANEPGYSSAYLVDGEVFALLSRKRENDQSGNYTPCEEDFDTSYRHRGIAVSALLCMDAADFKETNARHAALVKGADTIPTVLCVPAHMMSYGSREVALAWPNPVGVVIANSASSQPSVIRLGGDPILFKEHQNAVRLAEL